VLLTGRPDPGRWHADPPDLVSRLVATGQVQIEEPDDAMLALRLVEALAVRRLSAPEASIRYIAERLERRWTAVEEAADAIERSDAKAVTLPAARRVLAELGREQG
jgi:chromosomal replication initiation ATPase DnaA